MYIVFGGGFIFQKKKAVLAWLSVFMGLPIFLSGNGGGVLPFFFLSFFLSRTLVGYCRNQLSGIKLDPINGLMGISKFPSKPIYFGAVPVPILER